VVGGCKYFTEYSDIDSFTKMLKEEGYKRIANSII